ncbi:hypothetical protein Tco_0476871 [Tanacetum coccineum]
MLNMDIDLYTPDPKWREGSGRAMGSCQAMAPEILVSTNAAEFWCHNNSGAKHHFADVAPLFLYGTRSFARPLPVN